MSFQFTISPGLSKPVPKPIKEKQDEKVCVLLAPFTPNTKMCFENVIVGTIQTQKLFLENPSQKDIEVFVKNLPLPEKQVKIGWESQFISAGSTAVLEITWSPITEEAWRHSFTFEVTRFLKKEVTVSFKAVRAQKSKSTKFTKSFKRKVVSNKMKTPPKILLSSNSSSNGSSFCWTQLASPNVKQQTESRTTCSKIERHWNKENLHPLYQNESLSETNCIVGDSFYNPSNTTYDIETTNLEIKRNTYTKSTLSLNVRNYLKIKEEMYNDSLEESFASEEPTENQQLNNKTNSVDINQLVPFTPTTSTISDFIPNLCSSFCKSELDTNAILADSLNSNSIDLHNISTETYIKGNRGSEMSTICENFSSDTFIKDKSNTQKRKATIDLFFVSPPKKILLDYNVDHKFNYVPPLKWKSNKNLSITKNPVEYIDPFITGHISYNKQLLEEQEVCFQKWLNALLTPPAELDSNIDVHPVDVAQLWQQCKTKTVPAAPSKEDISNQYHTNKKLDVLRKSATDLFKSQELSEVFRKVRLIVESSKLSIRKDREVHLDLGLQSEIMTLFLSYNPLWLRIGLETIYGVTIQLVSNSDIMGLSSFIMHRFFKDPNLIKKHKSVHAPKYIIDIKKFILKKFLILVYFLDVAKTKGLIAHDPCLFCKNAPIKESREILLTFSKEVLSAVGDVTKFLRLSGYTVSHKQKYIHEFDYSVLQLGTDLRDGVRLTKVMEIILMKIGLTDSLRVPAISKLQKIYNMKVVFDALQNANFEIVGDIQPKDIVDGHYEKTLFFLWQIIYKFQAPRFIKAATIIQTWWRSLNIVIKRKVILRKKSKACMIIQRWYRHQRLAWKLLSFAENMQNYLKYHRFEINASKIQSYYRMVIQKRKFIKLKQSAICLQRYTRGYLVRKNYQKILCASIKIQAFIRMCICRNYYCRLQVSVINIQQMYKSKRLMLIQREQYIQLKKLTIKIQRRFRANKNMQGERSSFLSLKSAAITIQTQFRANQKMKTIRTKYIEYKTAVLTIQSHWRALKQMQSEKIRFQNLKNSCILIQRHFRDYTLMKSEYKKYQALRLSTIIIQQHFRAKLRMRIDHQHFQQLRKAVIKLQRHFRANKNMQVQRNRFLSLKSAAIIIQTRFRANRKMKAIRTKYIEQKMAALTIQSHWRALKQMQSAKNRFQNLRNSCILIQRYFRAYTLMKSEYKKYQDLRISTITIQQHFRATLRMRIEYKYFQQLRKAILNVQNRYKAKKLMANECNRYKMLKKAAIFTQRKYRANKLAQTERANFLRLKSNVVNIQRRFRARKLMKLEYKKFTNLRRCTIIIQRRFRAHYKMKSEKLQYEKLKNAVRIVQTKYRGRNLMKIERNNFLTLKQAVIYIQVKFRSFVLMKTEYEKFNNLKNAAIIIQRRFRANQAMKLEKLKYNNIKKCTLYVQTKFRANRQMKQQRQKFLLLKQATVNIQRRFRAIRAMRIECNKFINLRMATISIQKQFRANQAMKLEKQKYTNLKKSVIIIQNKFRATQLMKNQRTEFLTLRQAVINMQVRFRLLKQMKMECLRFKDLRKATITIQRRLRANRAMKLAKTRYEIFIKSVVLIQRRFRATAKMKIEHNKFLKLKNAVVTIQTRFRANNLCKTERINYQRMRKAVIIIQNWYRKNRLKQMDRGKFLSMKNAVKIIEERYKAWKLMKNVIIRFEKLKWATIVIQRRFRAVKLMEKECSKYLKLKNSAVLIQKEFRRYRNTKEARKELSKALNKRNTAALKIQTLWRAYRIRKQFPEIKGIRESIAEVTSKAISHDTLGNRRERALHKLINQCATLSQIIYALEDLEFITRRCQNTCVRMSHLISEQMYMTINSTNRSAAEMQVSTIAASILINFWKYEPARSSSIHLKYMNDIVTVMSHCCDKEEKLFPHLCTLFWLLAHDNNCKAAILSIPKCSQKLLKIKSLCLRKQKMVSLQQYKVSSYFVIKFDLPVPSMLPDWGLDYLDRPRVFTNSVHAFNCVLDILGLN